MLTLNRTSLLLLLFGSAGLAGWSGTALAFPLSDGADANHVVGQADFSTGFVDFDSDPFFGAQPASDRRFFVTSDVAYDTANQRLFVADLHNHRFLMFDLGDGITGDMAASLVLGQPDFVTGGTDPADPFGHFNTQNAAFGCTTEVNACGVHRAWGVAYSQGLLFGTDPDNNRVLVWDLASPANGMAATYVLGQPDFSTNAPNSPCAGAGADGACGMHFPEGVAIDGAGQRLFVADTYNNRVLVFDLSAGIESGMAATAVLGQASLDGTRPSSGCGGQSGGAASACGLHGPGSVAFDGTASRLFVSDDQAARVVVYDASAGIQNGMAATAVLGQPDLSTATPNTACGGGQSGEQNANPCGFGIYGTTVEIGGLGDILYVSDPANHRVLAFDVTTITDGEAAVAVLGQAGFLAGYDPSAATLGGATSRARMMSPGGLALDPVGDRLFVADGGNHRLLVFGANVEGAPVTVEGGTATTTESPDGSTTVAGMTDSGTPFSVEFPPGTAPLPGADEVTVEVEDAILGLHNAVQIEAELPPGATKSVTLAAGLLHLGICIRDHASAEISNDTFLLCPGGDFTNVPGDGQTRTIRAGGDLGDNPDDPDDPNGVHDVTVTTSQDGELVTIAGLRHSLVTVGGQALLADSDLALDRASQGPAIGTATGCGIAPAGGHQSAPALILFALFAAAVGYRRHRRRRLDGVTH